MWYFVVAAIFFAGGWAFYKHRAKIKAVAVSEANIARRAYSEAETEARQRWDGNGKGSD